MNETITIDGKDYEVLPLDRISEITHAKLAGGKVVGASWIGSIVEMQSPANYASTRFGEEELEPFGIQPLKLIERTPVEFVANGVAYLGARRPVAFIELPPEAEGKKFRCVEIVGEEA